MIASSHSLALRSARLTLALILPAVAAGSLLAAPVINELHYNNDINTTFNEFVEIYNPGPGEVDLSGWQLTGGIEFTFEAGTMLPEDGYLVIGERPSTIQAIYGVSALGPYEGGLSGEGETIDLVDEMGERIDRVNYDGGPAFPDPNGASMTLGGGNDATTNDDGANWCEGTRIYGDGDLGTPGSVNFCP